ncbi:hypothetical protein B0T22DRAFT_122438 [Podospora appendiculata]|uniref:Uncharacterized protein n=1 Tax=Podospora appendiculata TaxID=314037 RepID=A0AAE0X6U2_9PEZI|nr:hypothetical protein B0T22DRAFT_122438 [Podospora appendiculata]
MRRCASASRMEGAATNKQGNEPTLTDVIEDARKGRSTANFRLLRLCATFPALVAFRQEERYTDWPLTARSSRRFSTRAPSLRRRASPKCGGTWAEICEGSPKLARLGLANREEWAGSGEYVPPKKMIIFCEKTSKSY